MSTTGRSSWIRLRSRVVGVGPQLAVVAGIFLIAAALMYWTMAVGPVDGASTAPDSVEITRAVDEVADAVDRVAARLNASTTTDLMADSDSRVEPGSTGSYPVSAWWWVVAAMAFAALYYAFSRKSGAADSWVKYPKMVTAWAGALSAVAAMFTAGAGALAAVREAIWPQDDPLAIRQFIEFVPTAPQNGIFVLPGDISVIPRPEPRTLLTFAIPYGEASCSVDEQDRWPNTYPSDESVDFIRRLGAGLASCGSSGAKPFVVVRGFASSSEVVNYEQCDGAENSDDANLAIAHRRQRDVVERLRVAAGDSIELDSEPWASFEEMRDDREYNDRLLNAAYSSDRATLTRRVEIRVSSAGGCAEPPGQFGAEPR